MRNRNLFLLTIFLVLLQLSLYGVFTETAGESLIISDYGIQGSPGSPSDGAGSKGESVSNRSGINQIKTSSDLLSMVSVAQKYGTTFAVMFAMPETIQYVRYTNSVPELDFWLNTTDTARVDNVVTQVASLGCTVSGVYPQYGRVYGICDLLRLDRIMAIGDIILIYPNYLPIRHNANLSLKNGIISRIYPFLKGVDSSADVLMKSNLARAAYGVNGTGIKIGVISDSFDGGNTGIVTGSGCNRTIANTASQTLGNLPVLVYDLSDYSGGTDEGRAMSELVYDVAQGSTLMFHTAYNGEADFAAGITQLANCGAKVIVDDVMYFDEPMFQDGIIAQAAAGAVAGGTAYFSSAGNNSSYGLNTNFGTGTPCTGNPSGTCYAFGNSSDHSAISIPSYGSLLMELQWNDPFSGVYGAGASHDLDLYITDTNNNILTSSTNVQGCTTSASSGNPFEIIEYTNFGSTPKDVYVKVKLKCGNPNGLYFRLVNMSNGGVTDFDTNVFNGSTMFGHSLATGVVSVAAMNVSSTTMEPFTSLGGTMPFYFTSTGVPSSSTRTGPVITAPDGVRTSLGPPFAPFFGTSAAAPDVASVGVLLLQYKSMAPSALVSTINNSASSIANSGGTPLYGSGLINALNAFQSISGPNYNITVTATGVNGGSISETSGGGTLNNVTWNGTNLTGTNMETVPSATNHAITATATQTGVAVTWNNVCDSTSGNGTNAAVCKITGINASKNIAVSFSAVPTYTITATATGINGGAISETSGGGTLNNVTWNGTNLTGTNVETVLSGTNHTITATALQNTIAISWSGNCDSTSGNGTNIASCTISSIGTNKNISVAFSVRPTYTITLFGAGLSNGSISETSGGGTINNVTWNGATLSGNNVEAVLSHTNHTLTAVAPLAFATESWSGDCDATSGNGTKTATCTLNNVNMNKNVTATFSDLQGYSITVTATGVNGGVISETSGAGSLNNLTWNGTTLTGTNVETVTSGTNHTITADATQRGETVSWSGGCDSTSGNGTNTAKCNINNIGANKNITVTFSMTSYTGTTTTGAGTVTVSFTGGGNGANFSSGSFIALTNGNGSPPSGTAPTAYTFPDGLFDFTINNITPPGATVTLTFTYPNTLPSNTVYWKYGPTAGNHTPHWYQMPSNQVVISGNTLTLTITDGGLGDDDYTANGTITDIGGPGIVRTGTEGGLLRITRENR